VLSKVIDILSVLYGMRGHSRHAHIFYDVTTAHLPYVFSKVK